MTSSRSLVRRWAGGLIIALVAATVPWVTTVAPAQADPIGSGTAPAPGVATITRIAQAHAVGSFPFLVLSPPSQAAVGDLVVVTVSGDVAADAGWTVLSSASGRTFWRFVQAGDHGSAYAFPSSGATAGVMSVYRGVDPANPIQQVDAGSPFVTVTVSAPSVPAPLPGSMLLSVFRHDGNVDGPPAPDGMSVVDSTPVGVSSQKLAVYDQLLTRAGPTGTRSLEVDGALNADGISLLLRPKVTPTSVARWGEAASMTAPDGPGQPLHGETVLQVAAESGLAYAVTAGGRIVGWGPNYRNALVIPDGPGQVLNGKRVTQVALGREHALALTADGEVFAWGYDSGRGELTVPDGAGQPLEGKTVVAIAAGHATSFAVTSDGHVVAWGNDYNGDLDVPDGPGEALDGKVVTAVAAKAEHVLALTADGKVVGWGSRYASVPVFTVPDGPGQALDGVRATAIATDYTHSLALTEAGKVVAWGYSANEPSVPDGPGQALDGVRVVGIVAGPRRSLALTDDGRVVAWGVETNYPTPDAAGQALEDAKVAAITGSDYTYYAIYPSRLEVTAAPGITGTPKVGQSLSVAATFDVTPASTSWQWFSDGQPVGADQSTYEVQPSDVGHQISVRVTVTAPFRTTTRVTSGAVTVTPGSFSAGPVPALTGVLKVGQTLAATSGPIAPTPDVVAYTWFADGTPVGTGPSYTLTGAEKGKRISLRATASKVGFDDATATSAALGPVATDLAPSLTLLGSRASLRPGQSATLTWASAEATSVTASGAWVGAHAATGKAIVAPRRPGTYRYLLTASNANGTTVAQVVLQVLPMSVSISDGDVRASSREHVTVRNLLPGERVQVRSNGRVVAAGHANKVGVFRGAFKVSRVWGTYTARARGLRSHQVAVATYKVHIRCVNGAPSCD